MRAWRVHELGEPRDVMRLEEAPPPAPGPDELVVRVLAAAINFPDALICRGLYQVQPPLPFTPGIELCGEVIDAGPQADDRLRGQRVIGATTSANGALGEFATMSSGLAHPAPPALDDAAAAAFFVGGQTAWFGLHRRANLQAGETLLVHAAAGGVGSAAVQVGKAAGATVIGVVGGSEKAAVARELGADVVVDRHAEDFVAVVKDRTAGRGADVIYDPVGGDTYARSTKCVAFEGRIVLVGFTSGTIQTAALNHPLIKNYAIVGLHWGLYNTRNPAAIAQAHAELSQLAEKGLVKPYVSERLPLDQAADGVQRVADGQTVGRLVVLPQRARDAA